jgi:hypothetical protein
MPVAANAPLPMTRQVMQSLLDERGTKVESELGAAAELVVFDSGAFMPL